MFGILIERINTAAAVDGERYMLASRCAGLGPQGLVSWRIWRVWR